VSYLQTTSEPPISLPGGAAVKFVKEITLAKTEKLAVAVNLFQSFCTALNDLDAYDTELENEDRQVWPKLAAFANYLGPQFVAVIARFYPVNKSVTQSFIDEAVKEVQTGDDAGDLPP
jgi:hypothetical protein